MGDQSSGNAALARVPSTSGPLEVYILVRQGPADPSWGWAFGLRAVAMGVFMKTRALLLGASALIALSGAANATNNNGWYISLEAGASAIQDWQTVSSTVTHSHVRDYGFDTGWAVMGSVGYAFYSKIGRASCRERV